MNSNSMRNKIGLVLLIVFIFAIGFWGGFEYKSSLVKTERKIISESINNANAKAIDARIKSVLARNRATAEFYWDKSKGTYSGFCESEGALLNYDEIKEYNSDYYCNVSNDGTKYAISSSLKSDPKTHFCVDSTGKASDMKSKLGDSVSCN